MSYDIKHYKQGIGRKKKGKNFLYYYIDSGKEVSKKDLERIQTLKIPPNWTDVWISKDPQSAIQAVGMDSKGRKQYRYHQVHIEKADKEKFLRMYYFIKDIPKLDKIIAHDNQLPMYDKRRVISLMLQLIEGYQMRVGKEVYARQNRSYGISSLRKKHVKIGPGVIYLRFKGKSGQYLHFTIRNQFYVDSIRMLMKLEGDNLFQYITTDPYGNEKIMKVNDRDLNKYLQENMGPEYTIKDFRTYGANVYFIKALLNETKRHTPRDRKTIKKNIMNAIKSTANKLKHTGTVSKKSYVMNFALELYQNNPEFFVEHKDDDYVQLLLIILTFYKKHILENND
jgi:DNA topoisomerase-1